jgi:phosphoglycolate phosphatase-like HAD superfamily hydrolase
MPHRLILWDVDGTLITTVGVGRRVMEEAARLAAGLADVPVVVMSGKTDPQILTEIFTAAGLTGEHIDGILPDAMAAAEKALASLEGELRANGSLLPGVAAILERLDATPGVRQTLLTGNLTPNAAVKVAAFGITDRFDVEIGAYGTDHADRLELVPIALERVGRLRGDTYEPDEVWVIGDTANDLACARAGGVRCLLVGADAAELAPDADAWFETMADTDRVLDTLLRT